MTTCKITKLKFNNGAEENIAPNDIVVFVGPNNVGKSRSLMDIYKAFSNPTENIVIKDIEFEFENLGEIENFISSVSFHKKHNNGCISYTGYGYSIHENIIKATKQGEKMEDNLVPFFISQLGTKTKLEQCKPVAVINRGEVKTHPLHYIAQESVYREKVSNNFEKAFGKKLQIEKYSTKENFLRIGDTIRINDAGDEVDNNMDKYEKIMDTYPKVHEQGDGIKSFVGLLLNVIIENYSIFLIDEPESFLHQPQAKILGNELPDLLGDRQAFIATHSEALIRGLLEVAPERVKIIRITRQSDTNVFSVLRNDDLDILWKDPLLKYSNVLNSLFYEHTIICESDSDCQFYSIILSWLKEQDNRFPDTLFVYSSTKNRLHIIAKALKALNIDYKVLPDIDILRKEEDIKNLYLSCNGNWEDDETKDAYSTFKNYFSGENMSISKEELKTKFIEAIDRCSVDPIDATELDSIKGNVKLDKKWKDVKQNGIDGITDPNVVEAFNKLDEIFKSVGIFIVREGELESFVPEVSGKKNHGPKWVAKVLDEYQDLQDPVYNKVKEFIKGLNV